MRRKILTIFGTRPEAIKLAPVIESLSRHPETFDSVVGVTGQHHELLKQVLDLFGIRPDFNLSIMRKNQSLSYLTAEVLTQMESILVQYKPDLMLVQGDTTTVFASCLAAFYHHIRVGHVEAGLRTEDKYRPFPEEINRRLTDQMSDIFFAPTEKNRLNLLKNGIPDRKIHVTGNTVVDALLKICRSDSPPVPDVVPSDNGKMILVTAHRRESFGKPLENIFASISALAHRHPEIIFTYPVHPNPNVHDPAHRFLGALPNVRLTAPVDYLTFVRLMQRAFVIMTDSGGVQEEAPTLKKPLIVLRDKTERTEIVDAGGALLVGTDPAVIVNRTERLIRDHDLYQRMSGIKNPYGDGNAADRIVDILRKEI